MRHQNGGCVLVVALFLGVVSGCTSHTVAEAPASDPYLGGVARIGFGEVAGDELRFAGFVPEELVLRDPDGIGYVWLELMVARWCIDEGTTVEPPVDFMLGIDVEGRFEGTLDIEWLPPGGETPVCGVHSHPLLSIVDCEESTEVSADVRFCAADTQLEAWDVTIP